MHEYPCTITSVPRDYRKIGNGLIFRKSWPYTKLINYNLLKVSSMHEFTFSEAHHSYLQLLEEGIIDQLHNKWIKTRDDHSCSFLVNLSLISEKHLPTHMIRFNTQDERPREVHLNTVAILFILLLCGMTLSFIIALIERVHFSPT